MRMNYDRLIVHKVSGDCRAVVLFEDILQYEPISENGTLLKVRDGSAFELLTVRETCSEIEMALNEWGRARMIPRFACWKIALIDQCPCMLITE